MVNMIIALYLIYTYTGLPLDSEIGLCEINWNMKDSSIPCFDLCCDVCDTSIVGSSSLPILRRVHVNRQKKNYLMFNPINYIPVIKPFATNIVVYLRGVTADLSSVAFETLNCTLHVK